MFAKHIGKRIMAVLGEWGLVGLFQFRVMRVIHTQYENMAALCTNRAALGYTLKASD